MRQNDFKKHLAVQRVEILRLQLSKAIKYGILSLQMRILLRLKLAKEDVCLIQLQSVNIQSSTFNINLQSDKDGLRHFRFTKQELPTIMKLFDWNKGCTERNRSSP